MNHWMLSLLRATLLVTMLAWVVAFLSPVPVSAQDTQGNDSYEARIYLPGATMPVSTTQISATVAVVCDQPLLPANTAITINPTKVGWDDITKPGRGCIWDTLQNGTGNALTSFPVGKYELAMVSMNAVGRSVDSNRVPFTRLVSPGAVTGVRLSR